MLKSQIGKSVAFIAISLSAYFLGGLNNLSAQSPLRVLVVATNSSDANCLERIGREHVHVERLFAPHVGASPRNYVACNERVQGLLEFRLFVFRGDNYCSSEGFWRERMAAANPRSKVHCLSRLRCSVASDCERKVQQAINLHGALTSILPEHRAALDANLKSEILRLQLRGIDPTQFALSE